MDRLLSSPRLVRFLIVVALISTYLLIPLKRAELNRIYSLECVKLPEEDEVERKQRRQRPHTSAYIDDHYQYRPSGARSNSNSDNNAETTTYVASRLVRKYSHLPDFESSLSKFYKFIIVFQLVTVVKHLILLSLRLELARDLRYLDCYLIGRLVLNGRTAEYMSIFYAFTTMTMVAWQCYGFAIGQPRFQLELVEFLLHDQEDILACEARRRPHVAESADMDRRYSFDQQQAASLASKRTNMHSILELRNRFTAREDDIQVLLQPNRTFAAWSAMSGRLVKVVVFTTTFGILFIAPLLIYIQLPMLVTNAGFRLNHGLCVDWIASQPDRSAYAHMYRFESHQKPLQRRFFMAYSDYSPATFYTMARIVLTFAEGTVFFLSLALGSYCCACLVSLISLDVRLYYRHLTELLREAAVRMRWQSSLAAGIGQIDVFGAAPMRACASSPTAGCQLIMDHEQHMGQLQALVVDYFRLIQAYDHWASFITALIIFAWLVFSMLISTWVFLPAANDDGGTKALEWYTFHLVYSFYSLFVIGSFARVRQASRALYQLITIVAAHDCDCETRKQRWRTIMYFYSPTPMYCFSIMRFTQISWFLAFKLCAWLLSASFVMSSLYSVYTS